jgi:predicted flap endonuclease-1-like 5' DNA nuclease
MASLINIEGIGSKYAEVLSTVGIKSVGALLKAGATVKGRKEIAEKTNISEKLILEWVNLADLFRIRGLGEEYTDLLEEAGVDTIVELATRNPANLILKLKEVNEQKKLVRRLPSVKQVTDWINQAKKLPRMVSYN